MKERMSNEVFTKTITMKLEELRKDIADLQAQLQSIFSEIDSKQKQAEYIVELLKSEGVNTDELELDSWAIASVSDLAYHYLSSREVRTPVHYRAMAKSIMADGRPIPGKDPAANLLAHISRDERFVRTDPGTYGLAAWGLKPQTTRRKRKKAPETDDH